MNLKIRTFYSVIIFFVVFGTFADSVLGKLAPAKKISVEESIVNLKSIEESRSLSLEEKETLFLLSFLKDYLNMDKDRIYVLHSLSTKNIINKIETTILHDDAWFITIEEEMITKLKDNESKYLKALGKQSLTIAWIKKNIGRKQESYNILSKLFDLQYEKTMKLERARYGFRGPGPLGHSEKYVEFLLKMKLTSDKDKTILKRKLREMKLYISKIPQSRILT